MRTLSIDEASEATGVSAHTLRYYERIGLMPPVGRAPNGHRRFTEDDLGWIRFLGLLRATGMPIREMTEFVELTRAGDHTIPWRVEVLERYREALRSRMAADRRHLEALDTKIGIYTEILRTEKASA